jgi:2',3'-cyclic-nucleotide 2'-phosphodiesterase (5'-nucleotidase family)
MGDALSMTAQVAPDDAARVAARSKLIFESMGQLGYAGYVLGERDFVLGLDPLRQLASDNKVPLMAANLVDEAGKQLFTGHVVVKAGQLSVCAVAVTAKVEGVQGVTQTDPGQAALAELGALGQTHCDVKLLLAHMTLSELEPVLKAAFGFDLAVAAHQGYQMSGKSIGDTPVVFAGERGRQVQRLRLESAGGQSPFVDQGDVDRLHEDLVTLDKQIEDLLKRKKAATADQALGFDKTLDNFQTRRTDLKKRIAAQKNTDAPRVFKTELVNLGTDVADQADMLAAVNGFLAVYPEPHAPPAPPRPPLPVPPQK